MIGLSLTSGLSTKEGKIKVATDYSYSGWGKAQLASQRARLASSTDADETKRLQADISRLTTKYSGDINAENAAFVAANSSKAKQTFSITPFKSRMAKAMSMKDAYAQAGNELNPLYGQARTSAGVANQQQQALLSQQMNAKGQGRGGLAIRGAMDLSGQLQSNLSNLDVNKNAALATLAADKQNTSFNQANTMYNNNLNAWQANTNANLQTQQLNYGAGQDALNRQYQEARDSIGDAQWQKQFDQEVQQFGLSYALQKLESDRNWQATQQQLALQRYNAYSSGGGGSSGSPSSETTFTDSVQPTSTDTPSMLADPKLMSPDGYSKLSELTAYLDSVSKEEAMETLSGSSGDIINSLGQATYVFLLNRYGR